MWTACLEMFMLLNLPSVDNFIFTFIHSYLNSHIKRPLLGLGRQLSWYIFVIQARGPELEAQRPHKLGVVAYSCKPSVWEVETGGSLVSQPNLNWRVPGQQETLS